MNFKEYRHDITRTMNTELSHSEALSMLAMGLAGEVGELVDQLKKHVFHKHTLDEVEFKKELGDIMWYLGNLMNQLNVDEADVFRMNVAKLMTRYPEGFNPEDSKKRVDTVEEKLFEQEEAYTQHRKFIKEQQSLNSNKPT